MVELRTHEGIPTDPDVLRRWEALVEADPIGSFFQTPRYLSLWAEQLGTRATILTHEVIEDGRTIGVLPMALQREGSPTGPLEVVRFVGGTSVTDYLGPVALPEHRAKVADSYLDRIVADQDWDEFVIGGLISGSEWDDHWQRAARRHELSSLGLADEDVCPRVDLAGGFAGYLGRLGGKLRHELTRKARKLTRDAGETSVVQVPQAEQAEALERFFEMNVQLSDEKGRFFASPEMRSWFHALAETFGPTGEFRLHELHVGGAPGAACVSLVHGGEWGLYNSAFDPSLAMLAPGMVIVGELIAQAAEEGCAAFDLLRGDEAYKYRFGAVDRKLSTISYQRG